MVARWWVLLVVVALVNACGPPENLKRPTTPDQSFELVSLRNTWDQETQSYWSEGELKNVGPETAYNVKIKFQTSCSGSVAYTAWVVPTELQPDEVGQFAAHTCGGDIVDWSVSYAR